VSTGVYGLRARVLVHAPAEAVRARVDPVTAVIEPVDAERCLVLTGAHSLAALGYLVVMMGFEFEVQDPPELVTHLRELADRCHRATHRDQPGQPAR
jgi:predicted DNA-binding transcriptional regulator YafY